MNFSKVPPSTGSPFSSTTLTNSLGLGTTGPSDSSLTDGGGKGVRSGIKVDVGTTLVASGNGVASDAGDGVNACATAVASRAGVDPDTGDDVGAGVSLGAAAS